MELSRLVREVLAESSTAEPALLADEVLARIPAKQTREALRECLPSYVGQIVARNRAKSFAAVQRPVGKSWKQVAGDAWQRLLAERVLASDGWKTLGECTRDDLLWAAQSRRDEAAKLGAQAEVFEKWAELMGRAGLSTFAEMEQTISLDILAGAA